MPPEHHPADLDVALASEEGSFRRTSNTPLGLRIQPLGKGHIQRLVPPAFKEVSEFLGVPGTTEAAEFM